MIGIDTNVLVRFLVEGDDPRQASLARSLFSENRIAVAHTVLLEAEWVLRRSFRFPRSDIAAALLRLMGMPSVMFERKDSVLGALRAFEKGFDFADAMHVATSAGDVTEFATFDRDFTSRAQEQALLPPVRLLTAGA